MFSNFSEFMKCVVEARFDFGYIWQRLVELFNSVTQNSEITSIWDKITGFIAPYMTFVLAGCMVLGIVICLFGKKISGILKFTTFFVLGYSLGVHFLEPIIPEEVWIPVWVVGLVIAIIAAVAYKFLFVGVYSVAVLYSIYRLCYFGFFLDEAPVFSTGKSVTSLAVAAVVLILSLILFRFVEMLLTASLGSLILTSAFSALVFDLGAKSWVVELVVFAVIALLGFLFQVRTRRRY